MVGLNSDPHPTGKMRSYYSGGNCTKLDFPENCYDTFLKLWEKDKPYVCFKSWLYYHKTLIFRDLVLQGEFSTCPSSSLVFFTEDTIQAFGNVQFLH